MEEDLRDLLRSESLCDVAFKIGDCELKAHKCIIASRSPVFMAMMTHDTEENASGIVVMKDIDSNVFKEFLNFLYYGKLEELSSDNVVNLYTVADKYQVDELKIVCQKYMQNNFTVENFCDVLALSLLHSEEELTDAATSYFVDNCAEIVGTIQWQVFLSENVTVGNELFLKHAQKKKFKAK